MSAGLPETIRVAGVDVGSAAVKVVVLDETEGGTPVVRASLGERIRRRDPQKVAREAFEHALAEAGASPRDLAYVATTGEGEMVDFRTGHFYGMTTHARGGLFLDPEARAVVDIGALHARAVLMDERARVLGYRMTSQCASGSGQFLEKICRYLGITLDEIGPLSLQGQQPEACSSICAVLAETDVINMVSRGIQTANIIRGIPHPSYPTSWIDLAEGDHNVSLSGADHRFITLGDTQLLSISDHAGESWSHQCDIRVKVTNVAGTAYSPIAEHWAYDVDGGCWLCTEIRRTRKERQIKSLVARPSNEFKSLIAHMLHYRGLVRDGTRFYIKDCGPLIERMNAAKYDWLELGRLA